jgi:hypothetical protein
MRVGFKNSALPSNLAICSGIASTNHTRVSRAFRCCRPAPFRTWAPLSEGRIWSLVSGREGIVGGMWELESAAPPADPEARQIQITLAQSRPRYVSPDLEFAVWTATIGERLSSSRTGSAPASPPGSSSSRGWASRSRMESLARSTSSSTIRSDCKPVCALCSRRRSRTATRSYC